MRVLDFEFPVREVFRVLDYLNRVVSRLRVESSLHEDIEEKTHRCVIGETAVDISGPEQWVRWQRCFVKLILVKSGGIGEAD